MKSNSTKKSIFKNLLSRNSAKKNCPSNSAKATKTKNCSNSAKNCSNKARTTKTKDCSR